MMDHTKHDTKAQGMDGGKIIMWNDEGRAGDSGNGTVQLAMKNTLCTHKTCITMKKKCSNKHNSSQPVRTMILHPFALSHFFTNCCAATLLIEMFISGGSVEGNFSGLFLYFKID